jgi:hypothetical protein
MFGSDAAVGAQCVLAHGFGLVLPRPFRRLYTMIGATLRCRQSAELAEIRDVASAAHHHSIDNGPPCSWTVFETSMHVAMLRVLSGVITNRLPLGLVEAFGQRALRRAPVLRREVAKVSEGHIDNLPYILFLYPKVFSHSKVEILEGRFVGEYSVN